MGVEEPVGPAVDGSTEADQVRLFLGKEHDLVQMVFSEEEAGQVCVCVCECVCVCVCVPV